MITEALKDSIKIILNLYKEDKMSQEEVITLLETMVNKNNEIIYPSTIPYNPPTRWPWNEPFYQPWIVTCTTDTTNVNSNSNDKL